MAGLLDQFGSIADDPATMGLLAAAGGMFNASGPSLMPRSLGQVLGAGLTSGAGTYSAMKQTQLDRQKEQMQMDMLRQQVAQATRKNDLINNFLAQNMGGGQTSSQTDNTGMMGMPSMSSALSSAGLGAPSPQGMSMQSGGGFGGVPSSAIAADLAFNSGGKIGEWIAKRSEPTDFAKQLTQAGIDPTSPLGRQIMQQQVAKSNYVAPVNARPGAIMRDPFDPSKVVAFNPQIPQGGTPIFDADGNVTGIAPLAGAPEVTERMARAGASGKAAVTPISGYDASGQPVFTSQLAAAGGGFPAISPQQQDRQSASWTGGTLSDAKLEQIQQAAQSGNRDASLMLDSYNRTQMMPSAINQRPQVRPSLAPGVEKSIGGNVETMNTDFGDLYASNKQAPVNLAILDSIKKLAPQAITGSQQSKLAYVNGLLTLGGIGKADDLKTATDLLEKNANRLAINMRLGASGGGSDALQSLAQAANPNTHMSEKAIIDASNMVIGQIKMQQDQYSKLLPFKMGNDAQGYYRAQQDFTKSADPRDYQPQTPSAGLKKSALPGTISQGYRFKGGDPSVAANWEKQ